jgi:energy-coupling factor transporter ATP-binding protein EcfA2
MAEPRFLFREVDLAGMPGFGFAEAFSVRGLEGGLTVVHGPNGAGKSTLARSMQLLLWEDLPGSAEVYLEARAEVDGVAQQRRRSQGRLTVQDPQGRILEDAEPRNGGPMVCRYQIGLQDLLQRNPPEGDAEGVFARAIQRETVGVDLDEVARRLASKAPGSPRTKAEEFRKARETVRELGAAQAGNRDLEDRIGDAERKLASEAHCQAMKQEREERLDQLQEARELLALEGAVPHVAQEELLARLGEGTGDAFQARVGARRKAEQALTALAHERAALAARREALGFQARPREEDRETARTLLRDLPHAVEEVAAADQELEEVRRSMVAWRESSGWIKGEGVGLPVVTERMLDEAGRVASRLEEERAARSAWEEVQQNLARTQGPGASSLDPLGRVDQWLAADARMATAAPRGGQGPLVALLVAGASLALAAAFLALPRIGAAAAGGVAALATVGAIFLLRRSRPGPDRAREQDALLCRQAQADLEARNLWPAEGTAESLRRLREELLNREADWRAAQRCRNLEAWAAEGARMHREALDQLLTQSAGLVPGLDGGPLLREHRGFLDLMVRQVKELQAHRATEARAAGRRQVQVLRQTELEGKVDRFLGRFGRTPGEDRAAALEVLLRDLGLDLQQDAEAQRLDAREGEAREGLEAARQDLADFLANLGLTEATFPGAWEAFLAWFKPRRDLEDRRRAAQARRLRFPGSARVLEPYLDRGVDLEARRERLVAEEQEAHEALAAADAAVDALRHLRERLAEDRQTLQAATTQAALARAVRAQEERARELEELRARDLEGRALERVLARQKDLAEDQDRPGVVKRASELFQAFTGRYQLAYGGGRFLALDGRRRLALEELSDGTRVQLLLAVRLAFVELHESVRLPIFLDEVLANADDDRADAIVHAVLQIAATGRQVFYFTAQADELDRWRRAGLENPVVDLAVLRNLARAERAPLPGRDWTLPEVPEPQGRPLLDYVRELGAPGPSIWADLDDQHPWLALVDGDEACLADLLRRRVTSIALLRHFLAGAPEAPWDAVAVTLDALGEAQALLREHRPRILTQAVIAGMEIPRFGSSLKEKFTELVAGRETELQAILDEGLPGAFRARAEDLKLWLEEHHYLVPQGWSGEAIVITLRQRFQDRLPGDSPRWQAVERFVFEASPTFRPARPTLRALE